MENKLHILSLGFVNAYLLESDAGFILVDTGVPSQNSKIVNLLARHGCRPGQLKLIILTHGDPDHVGNALSLGQEFGSPIAMHQDDFPMVESGIMPQRRGRGLIMNLFLRLGKLRKIKDVPPDLAKAFTPNHSLVDGQSLMGYGCDAFILHTPGHTKGSICVLTQAGDLIAGDTLINMSKPSSAALIENPSDLKGTIDRLKKMPVLKVFPGHGKVFLKAELDQIKNS